MENIDPEAMRLADFMRQAVRRQSNIWYSAFGQPHDLAYSAITVWLDENGDDDGSTPWGLTDWADDHWEQLRQAHQRLAQIIPRVSASRESSNAYGVFWRGDRLAILPVHEPGQIDPAKILRYWSKSQIPPDLYEIGSPVIEDISRPDKKRAGLVIAILQEAQISFASQAEFLW